ncbi:MAG: hypothetical protein E6H53_16680 [Betaproteobacteria bacterium]|nr:MAG: hypothetical protein E6H53_16680 [Betaproteobacteria bacterium]
MKAEGLAQWIRGLEGECVGERFRTEHDAVFMLEQGTESTADGLVLGACQPNARVLQRFEELARAQREAAVAHALRGVVPGPFRADVITAQERVAPGIGIDDVTVPLDEQDMLGIDVADELFQDEFGVRLPRCKRRDEPQLDTRRLSLTVGQEERSPETHP